MHMELLRNQYTRYKIDSIVFMVEGRLFCVPQPRRGSATS